MRIIKHERVRLAVQAGWAFVTNSYLAGFVRGKIYQGGLKNVCVPGLNCYSCPGAVASCPLGALQNGLAARGHKFPMYVGGLIMLFGLVAGRFICGWLCPFGWIQELLNKIPLPARLKLGTFRGDMKLRWAKYGFLGVFVILLPILLTDSTGLGAPAFCKYVCPVGILEGGLPLAIASESVRDAVGSLFWWKLALLLLLSALSVSIYRPFCKYVCPLGAIYSLANKVSFVRYSVDSSKCVGCGICASVCGMNVNPVKSPNSLECIRCGKCISACPEGAISAGVGRARGKSK